MESMSALSVCPNCCPPCRRASSKHGASFQAVRRAGMFISSRLSFCLCGASRTDPRPFGRRSLVGALLFPPAGAVRQFSELLFLVCFRGVFGCPRSSPTRRSPAVSGGPVPFGGLLLVGAPLSGLSVVEWREVTSRAAGPCRTVSSRFDRSSPACLPHHRVCSGLRIIQRARAAAENGPFRC